MDDIQTILALISTLLGIILLILKIFEAWVTVSAPVKRFLSKPVIWIVIAALILSGVYWLLVYKPPPPVVALRTAHNRYVTAMGADWGWVLRAETDVIDDYEEFTLLCRENGKVAFQTWHKTEEGKNRYVTAMGAGGDWVLYGETDKILEYEEFTLLDVDTGKQRPCSEVVKSLKDDGEARIAIQTWHKKEGKNRLVTAMNAEWDWKLRAETNQLLPSERFTVELLR
jgi:hypothetical protein